MRDYQLYLLLRADFAQGQFRFKFTLKVFIHLNPEGYNWGKKHSNAAVLFTWSHYYSFWNMIRCRPLAVTGEGSVWDYIMTDEFSLENRNQGVLAVATWEPRVWVRKWGCLRIDLHIHIHCTEHYEPRWSTKSPVSNAFLYRHDTWCLVLI